MDYNSLRIANDLVASQLVLTNAAKMKRIRDRTTIATHCHQLLDYLCFKKIISARFTQNVDFLEELLPDLNARTIQLHGTLKVLACPLCQTTVNFDGAAIDAYAVGLRPVCNQCLNRKREKKGYDIKLRKNPKTRMLALFNPAFTMYNAPANEQKENELADLMNNIIVPNTFMIIGTSCSLPAIKSFITQTIKRIRLNKTSKIPAIFWINPEPMPSWLSTAIKVNKLFDYSRQISCKISKVISTMIAKNFLVLS